MRENLVITLEVEWQDLGGGTQILAIYHEAMATELDKFEEIAFDAVDAKFNPI